jgi:hypothetical protein
MDPQMDTRVIILKQELVFIKKYERGQLNRAKLFGKSLLPKYVDLFTHM